MADRTVRSIHVDARVTTVGTNVAGKLDVGDPRDDLAARDSEGQKQRDERETTDTPRSEHGAPS
jgi:hypothetical protein